jgi:N-acetylneuraminic acid mutarotase
MRTYIYLLLCLLVIASCDKSEEPVTEVAEDPAGEEIDPDKRSWQPVAAGDNSKPVGRHEAAFIGVGGKFYLLGGRDLRPVSIFDTQTKSWTSGSEPPLELHHFQPVVFENRIYIVGAMTGTFPSETPVPNVYIYDPASDEWTKGDEIPQTRRRGSTGNVLYEGKIYISCGIRNGHIGDHKNWLDSYDPSTGEWEVLADAPRSRDHFQAVRANGNIYVVAGRNSNAPDNTFGNTISEVDVYDIESNTWSTLPKGLPTARAGNAAILYDNQVLIIGGESGIQEKAHSEVEALNLTSTTWESLPPLLEGRHGTGVLEFQSDLYIASGSGNRGGSPELDSMEKYSQ